jgi:uncharacterized protein (TIGR03790 family)
MRIHSRIANAACVAGVNNLSVSRLLRAGILLASWFGSPMVVHAQTAANVAVVINDNSPESQRIGEHYAKTRGVPAGNVLRIRTSTEDTIDRDVYLKTIEGPIGATITRAGLQDRILYVVLTKGVPLRIAGTTGLNGTIASVDSELTLLYRRLTGQSIPLPGNIDNPFFLGAGEIAQAQRFSHRRHDIYLTTRIDAFTLEQALAMIDRAQTPSTDGQIVLNRGAVDAGEAWLQRTATRLRNLGQGSRVVFEATAQPARIDKPVLGYYSSGAQDPSDRVRSGGMAFTAGSIAANLASFDARTFRPPPDGWHPTSTGDKKAFFEGSGDGLIGDLIREGVTGVSGQVAEAYVLGAVRPDILLPAYLAGFNLAEAFYLALPTLSWQTVIVGDPLCAPFGRERVPTEQLEEPVDAVTELPGLFGKRRLAVVRAANGGLPDEAISRLVRSETLMQREDRVGARRALEEALRAAPQSTNLMLRLAQLEEEAGEHDSAVARYRAVLELQPDNVVALNNIAFSLAVRRNAPAEAVAYARRAVSLAPGSGVVIDTLGWVEHLLGNHAAAAKLLEQAVQLAPDQAEVRLHAAFVYMDTGDRGRAEAELKEAVRLNPALEGQEQVRRLRELIASGRVASKEPSRKDGLGRASETFTKSSGELRVTFGSRAANLVVNH